MTAASLLTFFFTVEYFLSHLPISVWESIAKWMTINLQKDQDNTTEKKYARKVVDVDEALRYYGFHMLIEDTYGHDTKILREHFKKVKAMCGDKCTMGFDRFS